MQILVLNAGSSSLKHQLFAVTDGDLAPLSHGLIERIGEPQGDIRNHSDALARIFSELEQSPSFAPRELLAIGHRVVHGGESFDRSVLIDDEVILEIRRAIPLAPLHNPPALVGIESARRLRPDLPQVAVFDTAFHQTLPPHAFRYALPTWCYEKYRVRRYGMHGTSHSYVSRRAADLLCRHPSEVKLITLHLGNGASVAAISGGRCVETSMGLTPLEGLVMGTRSGDLDPAVPLFLCREAGMTIAEVDRLLNQESGLKGLCGENDMRALLQRVSQGDGNAELALDVYCHRLRKYVGAYAAILGRLDSIVFTAGVGENSPEVRKRVCSGLDLLGIQLDERRNLSAPRGETTDISASGTVVRVFIIPTDEEKEIGRETLNTIPPLAVI
jgi:acetate kinase